MWRELFEQHRRQAIAALGAVIFVLAGGAVTLMPSAQERLERQGAPLQSERSRQPSRSRPLQEAQGGQETPLKEASAVMAELTQQPAPNASEWYAYITGSVRNPGVYKLPANARVFQLVDAAGGLDSLADRVAVNLAEPLTDGQHVHIPRKGENRTGGSETTLNVMPMIRQDVGFHAPGTPPAAVGGKIDLIRAGVAELEGLRGIGPTLARRIVEYRRQHGPFRSVEDLVQVRGIGAAKIKGLSGQAVALP